MRDPEDIEPIVGLMVYLDENSDGSYSQAAGEPSAITDADGKYSIQLVHAAPQGGQLLIAEAFTGSQIAIY